MIEVIGLLSLILGFVIAFYFFKKYEEKLQEIQKLKIQHIEEINNIRKEILTDKIYRSINTKLSTLLERFLPYSNFFEYDPEDAIFLGKPVDFLVFDGLRKGCLRKIILFL